MASDVTRYEMADGVVWLTLNRPTARNALNAQMRAGLWSAFERFRDDDSSRVLVITGAGTAFSAGGDLKEMATDGLAAPDSRYLPEIGRNIDVGKPVIAAVNGPALGGGFLLVQNSDLCVAADTAVFGITEARWGRGAPWAALLPQLIPPRIAMEILVTGTPITAQRAYEVGLVNQVVRLSELHDVARALARTIARNAPLTVAASRRMVRASLEVSSGGLYSTADDLFAPVYASRDAREGPVAFRERRDPHWEGR